MSDLDEAYFAVADAHGVDACTVVDTSAVVVGPASSNAVGVERRECRDKANLIAAALNAAMRLEAAAGN